jgi:hypothetical protein
MSPRSPFFPYAFPFLFLGMWTGVSYLLSRLSGWSALAARYRALTAPEGERLAWTSAHMGGVSFRSCLNLVLAPSGLFLVPHLPFRLFMPPLLIPWTDVRFEGFTRMFFMKLACFRLGAEGPIFAVFGGIGERVRPYLLVEPRAAYASERRFAESLIDRRILIIAMAAAFMGVIAALLAARR